MFKLFSQSTLRTFNTYRNNYNFFFEYKVLFIYQTTQKNHKIQYFRTMKITIRIRTKYNKLFTFIKQFRLGNIPRCPRYADSDIHTNKAMAG